MKRSILIILTLILCISTAWFGADYLDNGIRSTDFYKNKLVKDSLNKLRNDSIRHVEELMNARLDSLRDRHLSKLISRLPKGKFVFTDNYEIFDSIIRLKSNIYKYKNENKGYMCGPELFRILNDTVSIITYEIDESVAITRYKVIDDILVIEPNNTQLMTVYKIPEGIDIHKQNYAYKGILVRDAFYTEVKYNYQERRKSSLRMKIESWFH